jgi:hypothetical protein
MKRRRFLKTAGAIPVAVISADWLGGTAVGPSAAGRSAPVARRVRPGDAAWPSPASWEKLKQAVGGRLMELNSPLDACRSAPESPACAELFKELKNPYFVGDNPALTQTSG